MRTKLTDTGLEFSRIVAGCMLWGEWGADLKPNQALQLIQQCIDVNVTTFDHADIYGHYTTEKLFGDAIKKNPVVRQKIQLVTKCGIQLITPRRPKTTIKHYELTKEYIIRSAEQSLQNLHTDYIDLFLIHRPSPLMHPEEISEAFTQLKKDGKVLHFGVSNFTTSQFDMLQAFYPLVTNQIEVSPLQLNPFIDGTLDQCLRHQIRPMAYSVLAGGQFFGKIINPVVQRVHKVASELAEKHEVSIDQILIAWVLKHPSGILPIMGSTKIDRIISAAESLNIKMTDQEWFMIWQAAAGEEVA